MMKVWVCVDDKNFEFLIKNFVEDLYGLAPHFIETEEYLEKIEKIEKSGSHNVVIVDHDDLGFNGYVIQLYNSDVYDKEHQGKRESTLKRQYIDFKTMDIYRLICALDDIWDDLQRSEDDDEEHSYLQVPIRHYDIAIDSGIQLYECDEEGHFAPIREGYNTNHVGAATYLKKSQSQAFYTLLEERLVKKMGKNLGSPQSISTLQDIASFIGIKPELMAQVDRIHDSILRDCRDQPQLKKLLEKMIFEESSYQSITKLTMYTSIHACSCDASLNSDRIFHKLITAGLFRDVSLADEKLRMIMDLDHEFSRQSRRDRLAIRQHPIDSANQLNRFLQFSQDELLLIERHHEKPDGSGFPKGVSSDSMSSLQNLFITSHRFSHYLIDECSSTGGEVSHAVVGNVVSKMVLQGFAGKATRKYFSAIAGRFMAD